MKRLLILFLATSLLCTTPICAQKPLKKPPKPTQMTNSNQVQPANAQKNGITEPLLRDRTSNVYYGEDEDEDEEEEDDEFLFNDEEEEEDDDYNLLDDDDEDDW